MVVRWLLAQPICCLFALKFMLMCSALERITKKSIFQALQPIVSSFGFCSATGNNGGQREVEKTPARELAHHLQGQPCTGLGSLSAALAIPPPPTLTR